MSPDQVQQLEGHVRRTFARVKFLEQVRHFTDETLFGIRKEAVMPIRQKVVPQQWCMSERLHDAVHEARVAQIDQATQSDERVL